MSLTAEQVRVLRALASSQSMPRWGDADLIVACRRCTEVAICCSRIGTPRCTCGGIGEPVPHMDALLAAYRLGGWTAMMDACRDLLSQETTRP